MNSTFALNADFLRDLSVVAEDENLLTKAVKYIRKFAVYHSKSPCNLSYTPNILDLPNELKSELKSEQERNIVDIILSRKPVYQVAKLYEEQLKSTGELLFVERNLDEMLRRSQPKEYEPADKYIEHIPPIDLLDNYKNLIKFRDENEKEKAIQEIKTSVSQIIKELEKTIMNNHENKTSNSIDAGSACQHQCLR